MTTSHIRRWSPLSARMMEEEIGISSCNESKTLFWRNFFDLTSWHFCTPLTLTSSTHSHTRSCRRYTLASGFGAIQIPRTLRWLFRLSFLFSIKLKSLVPRLVSLLCCTLRMNAFPRIGIFATDGAKVFSDFRNQWYWLEDAHVAPSCECEWAYRLTALHV